MSKNSSRSVKKKLIFPSTNPLPDTDKQAKSNRSSKNSLTNDILRNGTISRFILEEDVINFLPVSADGSSESQSSWADDLEEKTTKTVKAEYDLVQRILYGEEKCCVYNEEFDQWADNFKHLRIVGSKIKLPNVRQLPDEEITEETFAEHRDVVDEQFQKSHYIMELRNKVKEAVLSRIIQKAYVYDKSNSNRRHRKQWHHRSVAGTSDTKNFMTNSNGEALLVQGGQQHHLIRSNISSARWQCERNVTRGSGRSFVLPPIVGTGSGGHQGTPSINSRSTSCNVTLTSASSSSRRSYRLPAPTTDR